MLRLEERPRSSAAGVEANGSCLVRVSASTQTGPLQEPQTLSTSELSPSYLFFSVLMDLLWVKHAISNISGLSLADLCAWVSCHTGPGCTPQCTEFPPTWTLSALVRLALPYTDLAGTPEDSQLVWSPAVLACVQCLAPIVSLSVRTLCTSF